MDLLTDEGVLGRAAVPSGASTGEHEAVELEIKDLCFMVRGSIGHSKCK